MRAPAKEKLMLMTPPANDPPLFNPMRAKTMDTAYKNAEKIANAADKLRISFFKK